MPESRKIYEEIKGTGAIISVLYDSYGVERGKGAEIVVEVPCFYFGEPNGNNFNAGAVTDDGLNIIDPLVQARIKWVSGNHIRIWGMEHFVKNGLNCYAYQEWHVRLCATLPNSTPANNAIGPEPDMFGLSEPDSKFGCANDASAKGIHG